MNTLKVINKIAIQVNELNGKVFFVGGYVRDKLLGIDSKDYDIEVHGITPKQLEHILDSVGKRIQYGEDFGVYSLVGYNLDIAMPRKEKLRGKGHTDFDIFVDPFIGTYKASIRRDFTINALMQDVITGEIIDFFNGKEDLKNKILRHVNEDTFCEDPLRVLRACQFASRFNFKIDSKTIELCKKIDLTNLSKERVYLELEKALMKSNNPSIFFNYLREMNQLDYWFKEIKDLINVPQNQKYHKEGDVWNHTMMVLDKGAEYRERANEKESFMLSCLCHDLGKPYTTTITETGIHSYNHEVKGVEIASTFLNRIINENKKYKYVTNMVLMHMRPAQLSLDKSSYKATNIMFDKSINGNDLILLCLSDSKGMIKEEPYIDCEEWLFDRLNYYNNLINEPRVTGKDLISYGIPKGKQMAMLISYAKKLHLSGVKKDEALKQTIAYANKKNKTEK